MTLPLRQLVVDGVEEVQGESGEPRSEALVTVKPWGAVRFDEPRLSPVPALFSFRNAAVIETPGTPAGTAAG
jgi:hypothetical protein